jgi:hypothetical protein
MSVDPFVAAMSHRNRGAVWLDNMTMQGAVRMLRTKRNEYPPHLLYSSGTSEDGFRVAVDVACLAQLVQSIVLHESIVVDQAWVGSWRDHDDEETSSRHAIQNLRDVVLECSIPIAVRSAAMVSATETVERFAASDSFKEYIAALMDESIDGTYIKMTHEYLGAGFADTALFGPSEAVPVLTPEMLTAWRSFDSDDTSAYSSKLLTDLTELKKFYRSLGRLDEISREQESSASGGIFDVAIRQGVEIGYSHVVEYVLQNVHAAVYYQRLADSMDIAYLPHSLRASFVAFDSTSNGFSLAYVGELFADNLEEFRTRRVEAINKLLRHHAAPVNIPLFLASILERVSDPSEIIDEALRLRDSPPAVEFRRWSIEIQDKAKTIPLHEMTEFLSGIQNYAPKWFKGGGNTGSSQAYQTGVELNLGVVTITQLAPTKSLLRRSTKRHLRVFQNLADISNSVLDVAPLLARTFGDSVAGSYSNYSTALDRLEG